MVLSTSNFTTFFLQSLCHNANALHYVNMKKCCAISFFYVNFWVYEILIKKNYTHFLLIMALCVLNMVT